MSNDILPERPQAKGLSSKQSWLILLVAFAALCWWLWPDSATQLRGSSAVYERIEATTDCAELQATFDRASDSNDRYSPGSPGHGWTTDYMVAADKRMETVGCY